MLIAASNGYISIIMIVVLVLLMYFLMLRPQKKQQQKHADTLSKLQKGDHIVTIGRLHGVIDNIDRDHKTVTLDCDGIYLEFDLNAIAKVQQRAVQSNDDNSSSHSANNQNANKSSDNQEKTSQSEDENNTEESKNDEETKK